MEQFTIKNIGQVVKKIWLVNSPMCFFFYWGGGLRRPKREFICDQQEWGCWMFIGLPGDTASWKWCSLSSSGKLALHVPGIRQKNKCCVGTEENVETSSFGKHRLKTRRVNVNVSLLKKPTYVSNQLHTTPCCLGTFITQIQAGTRAILTLEIFTWTPIHQIKMEKRNTTTVSLNISFNVRYRSC